MKRRKFLGWIASAVGSLAVGTKAGAAVKSPSRSSVTIGNHAASALVWPKIAKASSVPVGTSVVFTYGAGSQFAGRTGSLYHESASVWKAFDLVCTHHGCPVQPSGAVGVCPCHHSEFSLTTGAVLRGPAMAPLTGAEITVKADGYVYWLKDL
jgi:Rieske Fe-S protein